MDNAPNKKILLADDDRFVEVVYKEGLEHAGYQVLVARDGQEALTIMQNDRPDLVVLDIIMPKLNGFEVLKTMRADPALAALPVLVLTNLSQDSDIAEAHGYGIIDFLVKSNTTLAQVLQRIQNHFLGLE